MHNKFHCPGPHASGHSEFDPHLLHVITTITNPVRYSSRYRLYEQFAHHMKDSGVNLWTMELAYGDRTPAVVDPNIMDRHILLRTHDELWHKENLINLAIQRLPADWQYVAWVDADIQFLRKDWVQETIQQLQHHHFVQMFETAVDMGPHGQAINTHQSFMSQYVKGRPYCYGKGRLGYYEMWHPGYAWAADRQGIEAVGGLLDTAILGAGDNHMAHALIGMIDQSIQKGLHPNYLKNLRIWQDRAEQYVRRDVGYVSGSIIHNWHGRKKDRRYHDRWQILIKDQYNPEVDLKRDAQGVWQIHDTGSLRSIALRDDIRRYFRVRNEDSIDLT